MKTRYFLILLLSLGLFTEIRAQTPVPEDYFDLFDGDEEDDEEEDPSDQISMPDELEIVKFKLAMMNLGGSFGSYFRTLHNAYIGTKDGCSQTYICMTNLLSKIEMITTLEENLKGPLSCKDRQIKLEDYIMFIGMLNLDIYCMEHLHPDNNELTDEELVDVMLVMSRGNDSRLGRFLNLESYKDIKDVVQPYCINDLEEDCGCGEFIGVIDETEKGKVIKDIRVLVDAINPFWQAQKVLQLNQELQTITPCSK